MTGHRDRLDFKYLMLLAGALLLGACGTSKVAMLNGNMTPEVVLNLHPGPNNPRNSEGDFIELFDGRVLFIYSHYYGTSPSDHGSAYLASRISSDRGKTWSATDKIEVRNEGAMNVMSISLLRLRSGEIALFYLRKNSISDCIPMIRISKDEAKTWSDAVPCITDREGYFILNNDRVIQRADGRLLMAVAQHISPVGGFSNHGILYCYHSDDDGKTWKSSEPVANPEEIIFQEPGLVMLKDDALLMYIRSNAGTQCFSKSTDGGSTWGPVVRSQLISPLSPATIERISSTGDLLAVWNNNLSINEEEAKLRCPLNIAISRDEGVSWEKIKVLESDPDRRYCYTAMAFVDDSVLLAFADGSYSAETHWGLTKMIKVPLRWVYE